MRIRGIAIAATVVLSAIGAVQAQQPVRGGTLVVGLAQDPPLINPAISTSVPNLIAGCMIYQGLLDVGPDFKFKPSLAKSWSVSPDGKTYSFDLVEAQWADGKPFTSDDVKFSLMEVSAKYSPVWIRTGEQIESVETPNPRQIVFHMKQPYGPFTLALPCENGGAILPAHVFRGSDPRTHKATTDQPLGLGAFQVGEWKRGDFLKMVRNPTYRDKEKPYLDAVVFKVITSPAGRIAGLRSGELDLVPTIPPNALDEIKADPKLKLEQSNQPPNINLAFYNVDRKPLNDKRVRHALFMATDRNFLMKNVFFGIGKAGMMPFTSAIPWAADNKIDYEKMYPFNMAKANALLDEAGVKRDASGKRFALKIVTFRSEYPGLDQTAVAMKGMWKDLGIDVEVDLQESAAIVSGLFQKRDFDIGIVGYGTNADPSLGIARAYTTTGIGQGYGNPSGYSNPKVDQLFAEAEKAPNQDARGKIFVEIQTILAEDLPAMNIREYFQVDAASKRLHNMWGASRGSSFDLGWLSN